MNHVIEQLQEDHRQLIHVLYNLEREAKACSGLSPEDFSVEAILDIIDYIQVWLGSYPFPAFNIADAAISVGAVLLILSSFTETGKATTE